MKFQAKKLDLKLELVGSTGEQKVFEPKERITSKFAESIIKEMTVYIEAQTSLPATEQDKVWLGNLKFLSWMYKDFDVTWVKENFDFTEVAEIRDWAFKGLNGIKKDGES